MKPLAIVTGVGPGTGSSIVRRFAAHGYRVAMLARNFDRLAALAQEIPDAVAVPVDVSDAGALIAAVEDLIVRFGTPKVVVHNAVGGAFGNFLDIDPAVLEQNFQTNVMALYHLARQVLVLDLGGLLSLKVVVDGDKGLWRGPDRHWLYSAMG